MRITDTSDLWWKTAVIYCLDVADVHGLERRRHAATSPAWPSGSTTSPSSGVTCLWLMPFYPTADRDDGYDITDYYGVDPRLGHARRLRRGGPHRARPRHAGDRRPGRQPHLRPAPVVPGGPVEPRPRRTATSTSGATTSRRTPRSEVVVPRQGEQHLGVRREDRRVVPAPLLPAPARPQHHQPARARRDRQGRWASGWSSGISGFRVDAVPFLLETDRRRRGRARRASATRTSTCASCGPSSAGVPATAILLGEVNLPHKDQKTFFGGEDGDELTMQFDFIGMQNLYLSLARAGRPAAGASAAAAAGDRPGQSQWATFVRNHDELTLDKLTDAEREEVFAAFGPDPDMQLYGRGLRRRLPTMLDGDPRRIRMVYSLLFSLPGHPGALLRRGDRHGREPRRRRAGWPCARRCSGRPGATAASPRAPPSRLRRPVREGAFGPEHVNVADQRTRPRLAAGVHRSC